MVELTVKNTRNEVLKRVAVDEELFWKYVREKKDLSTRWYRRLFAGLFYPLTEYGYYEVTTVDTTGTSRTTRAKGSTSSYKMFWNTDCCNHRPWIAIGSGTTPPTLDDYELESKIAEAVASWSLDEENGILTLSAGFTPDSDINVNEVGLYLEGAVESYNECGRLLLDRTVLPSTLTVQAGKTLTVAYRIAF